jgi:hypothetical protein
VAEQSDANAMVQSMLTNRGGRRDFVPVARCFVQQRQVGGGAGPLSWFVKVRRERALDLYLLTHALASTPPYDVALPARSWARALGLPDTPSARVFISSSWTWLEQNRLVRTQRDGRLRRVWLLDESASGEPYQHSTGYKQLDYFKLPYAFWSEGWTETLDLPAKAALLIALSLSRTFTLPQVRGGEWYGLSRDTIRRGLRGLVDHGLLSMRVTLRAAPLSPTGSIEQRRYTLVGAFAQEQRRTGRRPPEKSS